MSNPSEEYLKKIQTDFVDKLNGYMNIRCKMEPVQIKAWTCALARHQYADIRAAWTEFMVTVKPGYLPSIGEALDMIKNAGVRQREIFSNKKKQIEERQYETRPEEFAKFIKAMQLACMNLKSGTWTRAEYYNYMADVMDKLDIKDGAREHRTLAKKWISDNPIVVDSNVSPI